MGGEVGELSLRGWEAPRLLAFFCGGKGEGRSVDSKSMYSRVFRVHNSTQLSEARWPCVGGAGVGGRGAGYVAEMVKDIRRKFVHYLTSL